MPQVIQDMLSLTETILNCCNNNRNRDYLSINCELIVNSLNLSSIKFNLAHFLIMSACVNACFEANLIYCYLKVNQAII